MQTKEITLIALLSASLTAGKLILSFVPNVEIVTLLLIVFTVSFGFKRTIITSIIFVTTEVLIYGFGTWIMGYYIIWPSLVLLTSLVMKMTRSEYAFSILSGFFGATFGLFFAIYESLFYGWSYAIPYWIRGIPFDIIHGVSNLIIVIVLFKPLMRTMEIAKQKMRLNE